MLGRAYSLAGPVVRGDQLGRQLGFPTANLDVTGLVLPPNGVYAVHARDQWTDSSRRGEYRHPGPRCKIRRRKSASKRICWTFNGDLYGEEMEITLLEKLRDEKKFPSLEALRGTDYTGRG